MADSDREVAMKSEKGVVFGTGHTPKTPPCPTIPVTAPPKPKVDLAEVLSAIGLLEMVGRLEQAIDRVDRAALAGNKEEWPTWQDWLATAEALRQAWRDEVEAHARTKRELAARIEELQAALAMQAGE